MTVRPLSLLLAAWLLLVPTGAWFPGLSSAAAQTSQDVEIELEQFGVGSAYRPGDMGAIRLRLTSNLDDPISVWVQWEVPNADGDIGEYGRVVSLTRGRATPVWLYAPLLPEPAGVWSVRVFEDRDGERRAELGGMRISPSDATRSRGVQVPTIAGLIGVLGRAPLGLEALAATDTGMERPHSAHEQTRIVRNMSPSDCPDRWFGWQPFEALVWGDAAGEQPQDLGTDRAGAIREWIERGGHFVIVLPQAGNPWGIGITDNVRTELTDLLPAQRLGTALVPLEDLLPHLSKIDQADANARGLEFDVHVFRDPDAGLDAIPRDSSPYEPLIVLDDGKVIAVQRLYGHGRITIIGVNIASGQLSSIRLANGTSGLPQGDAFWNRILGRRADLPTSSEINEIRAARRLNMETPKANGLGRGQLISQQISMSRKAAVGLMLALVLFAIYWLVAGPGGFALLKQYRRTQHSWVAFAGAAAAFTAVAWGAVSLMPTNLPDVKHVTVLDHVARPQNYPMPGAPEQRMRAVAYLSVYLDDYRKTRVSIDSTPGERDVLHSWTAPGVDSRRFPNVDRYRVDVARGFADFEIPARSTATQMVAYWHGGLDTNWVVPILEDSRDPISVTVDPSGREQLQGSIIVNQDLPADLTDVTVIWVRSDRLVPVRYAVSGDGVIQPWVEHARSGQPLNNGYMARVSMLRRNQSHRLAELVPPAPSFLLERNIADRYVEGYANREFMPASSSIADDDVRNYMEMLSIYHQLEPPPYLLAGGTDQGRPIVNFTRETGRPLDLSAWFTRPCLIIMGYLEDAPTPVPLRLGGSTAPPFSEGRTLYRWICPLPLREELAFRVNESP